MQVEVKIDSSCTETSVIIITPAMTEDVHSIVKMLSDHSPRIMTGYKDEKLEILEPDNLIRIYASSGKVFAVTPKGEYTLRLRLYELEERLDPYQFVRISNSEIINLKKVKHFDLNFTGTICARLSDGTASYVSRRYVPKIKEILMC
ncbi:MAG: LytTR family transcriptional regulator [Lachnospiraceae bacterium]|nr:LytTR family transcriptional regulator [Lachnospiraceae bacterium]